MALFNGRMYCVRDSGGRSTRTRVEAAGDSESSTTKTTGSQTARARLRESILTYKGAA